jgi:hypothetical protein
VVLAAQERGSGGVDAKDGLLRCEVRLKGSFLLLGEKLARVAVENKQIKRQQRLGTRELWVVYRIVVGWGGERQSEVRRGPASAIGLEAALIREERKS